MKTAKKGCLITLFVAALICLLLYIPIWHDDAEARQNKNRVKELIFVGQDMDEAQRILRHSGFRLRDDTPTKPTIDADFLLQLVIVGETQPNSFESLAYAGGFSWMPFTHSEFPYVRITADLEGKITGID